MIEEDDASGAIHEAGHIVVALALGCVVAWAVAEPRTGETRILYVNPATPAVRAMVAMAGNLAEGNTYYSGPDLKLLRATELPDEELLQLGFKTGELIKLHVTAVAHVAIQLRRRGALTGLALKRIACAASPALRKLATPLPRAAIAARFNA